MAEANHPAVPNGLKLTYAGAASGDYSGFDRLGRVVWQRWLRSSGDTAADRHFYGYDRAGNRTWRAERANASSAAGQRDEAYVYDKLDRLVGAKRGILPDKPYQAPYPGDVDLNGHVNGTDYSIQADNWEQSGMAWTQGELNGDGTVDGTDYTILSDNWLANPNETVAKSWSWSLDPRGNWSAHKQDNNGDGDPNDAGDVNQTRTHDKANEITSISGVALAPLYDQAGNNPGAPGRPTIRPADPNANNAAHFRYDAWNRLCTIHLDNGGTAGTLDGSDTLLASYRYDGLNRRVMKVVDVDGNPGAPGTDYVFFNEGHGLRSLGEAGWQIVEIRRGVNQTPTTSPYKQFVYDIRYIDSPVCRWWDKDSDGTMEPTAGEMQYFTNDGNFNTTALVDANSGSVVERYLYDPYGKVTVLNGASGAEKDPNVAEWSPDADNKSDWDNEVLFCGYWYDPETGLYHVRERYYDPLTGTWKTRDRILYGEGMNLYQYVRSNPVVGVDPYGLWDEDMHHDMTLAMANAAGIACAEDIAKGANEPDVDPVRMPGLEGVGQMAWYGILDLVTSNSDLFGWKTEQMAKWHFPADDDGVVRPGSKSQVAEREVRTWSEKKACNLTHFSEGLHILQDSWAHQGRPYAYGVGHGRGVKETVKERRKITDPWGQPDEAVIYQYELTTDWSAAIGDTRDSADEVKYWEQDARETAQATYKWLMLFKKNCPCHCPQSKKTSCNTSPICNGLYRQRGKLASSQVGLQR